VAVANGVPTHTLVDAFLASRANAGFTLEGQCLDFNLPSGVRRELEDFCRMPRGALDSLDLARAFPNWRADWIITRPVAPPTFLAKPGPSRVPRLACGDCWAIQREPQEFALAFLTHCPLHLLRILDEAESDPRRPFHELHTTLRPGLDVQRVIAACTRGVPPDPALAGPISAIHFLDLVGDLADVAVRPTGVGRRIVADSLVPERLDQGFSFVTHQPNRSHFPSYGWLNRWRVMAVVATMILGEPLGFPSYGENSPTYPFPEIWSLLPQEGRAWLVALAQRWPPLFHDRLMTAAGDEARSFAN
jgi:hypothetical protein